MSSERQPKRIQGTDLRALADQIEKECVEAGFSIDYLNEKGAFRYSFRYQVCVELLEKFRDSVLDWPLKLIVSGFEYDPGQSDLDDEQPIHVRMTLGDYRSARRALKSGKQ